MHSPAELFPISQEESRDMPNYSTGQVAKKVGVNKSTLLRWLYTGKLKEPERLGTAIRFWSDKDVERVKKYKQQFYRKGRGRKRKT